MTIMTTINTFEPSTQQVQENNQKVVDYILKERAFRLSYKQIRDRIRSYIDGNCLPTQTIQLEFATIIAKLLKRKVKIEYNERDTIKSMQEQIDNFAA